MDGQMHRPAISSRLATIPGFHNSCNASYTGRRQVECSIGRGKPVDLIQIIAQVFVSSGTWRQWRNDEWAAFMQELYFAGATVNKEKCNIGGVMALRCSQENAYATQCNSLLFDKESSWTDKYDLIFWVLENSNGQMQ